MNRIQAFILSTILILCACTACETNQPPLLPLAGEWRYVGTFDHRADYICLVCNEFDYDKSLYQITFNGDKAFTAKINLLLAEGSYQNNRERYEENQEWGYFSVTDLRILNKPPETEADGIFQQNLLDAKQYNLVTAGDGEYDFLQLQFEEYKYLYFVRKK